MWLFSLFFEINQLFKRYIHFKLIQFIIDFQSQYVLSIKGQTLYKFIQSKSLNIKKFEIIKLLE